MRCVPRTDTSAFRMASWVAPARSSSWPAGSLCSAIASSMCSVETNSSLKRVASSKAFSSVWFMGGERYSPGCIPAALGRLPNIRSASATIASGCTLHFSSSGRTMPSRSPASAISRCSGKSTWPSCFSAIAWACCKASCAFCVSLSNRNISPPGIQMGPGSPRPGTKEDRPGGLSYSILLLDFDLDLPRLGSFLLGKRHAEHAILEVRRDVLRVEGIGHGKAAHETAVAALDAVIALLGMFLVELALARDGERLVLHFDVNVLQIDVRQIGLQHQFVLGFVDVHGRRPRTVGPRLVHHAGEGVFEETETG